MKKNDKNIVIILAVVFVGIIIWIMSQYTQTKNNIAQYDEETDATEISDPDATTDLSDENESPATVIPTITPYDLNQKMSLDSDLLIIDIRTRDDFDAGHIRKSYHIDMIDPMNVSQSIVFVTASGNEDMIMPHYRNFAGARSIENLTGGIAAWTAEGFSLLSFQTTQTFANASKVLFIEPRDLNAILTETQNEPITIIDVRRNGNYLSEHVPSAINIPLDELEYRYTELPTVRNVYVYGVDELQSFQAGALLHDLNFINTHTIKGGFAAWKEYNYPTISEQK
jgi:rhodanese-related sulfurtransferase